MSADAFDAVQTVCAAYLGELPVWEEVLAGPSRLHFTMIFYGSIAPKMTV